MPPVIRRQSPSGTPSKKTGSVLDRIGPIGFEEEGLKMLLYGRSGTGKTTLWATFPKPILAVLCSGGDKPGELRSVDTAENRKTIRQVTLNHSAELIEIVDHVKSSGEYATVVLDHASGLQDKILAELLDMDELPAQKSWGLATQQTYGQCTLQCKEVLRKLLGIEANVVIIAQERNFGEESNSDLIMPTVGAGITPSLAGWLNTAVDYICQTFLRQKEVEKKSTIGVGKSAKVQIVKEKIAGVDYCLRTAPHPVFTTKFRQPRGSTPLPEVIVDPDYGKILGLVKGGTVPRVSATVR